MRATKFAAVGMSFALLAGCTSGSSESKSSRQQAIEQRAMEGYVAPPVGELALSGDNVRAWSPKSPMTRPPGEQELYVDGWCAIPVSADLKDNLVVVYQPRQVGASEIYVESGAIVYGLCYLIGQVVKDGDHHQTAIWIKIATKEDSTDTLGYIPAPATGFALPPNPC